MYILIEVAAKDVMKVCIDICDDGGHRFQDEGPGGMHARTGVIVDSEGNDFLTPFAVANFVKRWGEAGMKGKLTLVNSISDI
jgi:hypothetical protein